MTQFHSSDWEILFHTSRPTISSSAKTSKAVLTCRSSWIPTSCLCCLYRLIWPRIPFAGRPPCEWSPGSRWNNFWPSGPESQMTSSSSPEEYSSCPQRSIAVWARSFSCPSLSWRAWADMTRRTLECRIYEVELQCWSLLWLQKQAFLLLIFVLKFIFIRLRFAFHCRALKFDLRPSLSVFKEFWFPSTALCFIFIAEHCFSRVPCYCSWWPSSSPFFPPIYRRAWWLPPWRGWFVFPKRRISNWTSSVFLAPRS